MSSLRSVLFLFHGEKENKNFIKNNHLNINRVNMCMFYNKLEISFLIWFAYVALCHQIRYKLHNNRKWHLKH